jgi:hypothetical protein
MTYVPERFIPDGTVVLGEPEPVDDQRGDRRLIGAPWPVPRGFESHAEYAAAGAPYHPFTVRPGEEGPGIPERVYRRHGMGRPWGARR